MSGANRGGIRQSRRVALCGMLTALGAALMLASGLIPVMTYAAPIFCSMLLLAVLLECSFRDAWLVWLATALLVLLMGADKEAAFLYIFIGYYPMLKWPLERRFRARGVQTALKLLFFAVSLALMYLLLIGVLGMTFIRDEFSGIGLWLSLGLGAACLLALMLYDRLLLPLSILYVNRLQPRLRRFLR